MTAPSARTDRFGPLDRAGWILGLGGLQCVSLAVGVVLGGALVNLGAPAPIVLAPVLGAVAFAFATVERQPVHELAPAAVGHALKVVSRRTRWTAEVPFLSGADDSREPSLPPFLAGLTLVDAGDVSWSPLSAGAGVGVIVDRRDRTASASLPVRGRDFALLDRGDQERLVQLWGDALAGFCSERTPVSRVRVTEWAAPAGLGDQERYLATAGGGSAGTDAHRSYAELLADAGQSSTSHELLVTVTVDTRRLSRRAGPRRAATDHAVEVLIEELRLLTARLESAGLAVDPPLSATATAEVLRVRCDPSAISRLCIRSHSLAALAGVVARYNLGPLATESGWAHLRADDSLHRTYWVAEWPRLDVGPNWLEPLLLHAGGIRTFAVHYEPVAPSRAQRRIDRDATRLAADEEQRSRSGFRIGARHRRAEQAVLEREAELVAGYAELEFAGFLTASAPDEESLARACAEYEQAAAQAGLELRPLHGRQDVAFLCTLPLGRGPAPRRWT